MTLMELIFVSMINIYNIEVYHTYYVMHIYHLFKFTPLKALIENCVLYWLHDLTSKQL